ncbi:MAG: hypothetical protein GQ532_18365 [Methylomarinum sp.]|nr:hypothetical protein [Methylomarinum sp.]
MSVRIDPVVLHIRGYADGVDINKTLSEMTAPYRFHCLVVMQDNGVARIQGLSDGVSMKYRSQIKQKLKLFGVKEITWRHAGREFRKVL